MAKQSGNGFLPTTSFYKSANYAAILTPENQQSEGKGSIQPEGTAVNKQENKTINQIATRKIHADDLHAKLRDLGEYRIHVTEKQLHYSIKGILEVCDDCTTAKSKDKPIHIVAE